MTDIGEHRWCVQQADPTFLRLLNESLFLNFEGYSPTWTSIQINEDVTSITHRDTGVMDSSYVLALGQFEGGALILNPNSEKRNAVGLSWYMARI